MNLIVKIFKGLTVAILIAFTLIVMYRYFSCNYNPKPDGFKKEQP